MEIFHTASNERCARKCRADRHAGAEATTQKWRLGTRDELPNSPVSTACGQARNQSLQTFMWSVWVMGAEEIKTQNATQQTFVQNEK